MSGRKRVIVGALLVGLSGAVTGISAFNKDLFLTWAGLLVFVQGYTVSAGERIRDVEPGSVGVLLAGILMVSLGLIVGVEATENPVAWKMIASGVLASVGYKIAHVGYLEAVLDV